MSLSSMSSFEEKFCPKKSNDLPTTTGKKLEQIHRSPVQERLHGCDGGQEKTPGDT